MDASMIAIGTRAGTTNALSIPINNRASVQLTVHSYSAADGDQTERLASPSPRRRSTSGGDEAAAIEVQRGNFEVRKFEPYRTDPMHPTSRQRFLARVSVGMDVPEPEDLRS